MGSSLRYRSGEVWRIILRGWSSARAQTAVSARRCAPQLARCAFLVLFMHPTLRSPAHFDDDENDVRSRSVVRPDARVFSRPVAITRAKQSRPECRPEA